MVEIAIENGINLSRLQEKIEEAEQEICEKNFEGGYILEVLVTGGAGVYKYQELFELFAQPFQDNVEAWDEFVNELTEALNAYVEENLVTPLVLRVEESETDGDIQIRAYNVEDLLFLESFVEIA